jgi:tRNA threonylcarbamoyladenosine biosynthesis protein TsaE
VTLTQRLTSAGFTITRSTDEIENCLSTPVGAFLLGSWRSELLNGRISNISLPDLEATRCLGNLLGQILPAGSVLLLNGDLGSGKTTLVQGIGTGLGILDSIVSPTFTLLCEYPEGRVPLYHFDLYRLQPSEVEELAIETYWASEPHWSDEQPPGIVAIEWAERLPYLPSDYLSIDLTLDLSRIDPGRLAQFQAIGTQHQQLLHQIGAALGYGKDT